MSSLGPVLGKLKADGTPYVARRLEAGGGAGSLFLPIPGSSFSFELVSSHGLEAEEGARMWDVCSES